MARCVRDRVRACVRVLLLQAQLQVALEQLSQLRALHRQATSACRQSQLQPAAAGGGGGGGGEGDGATAQEVARLRSALAAEEARGSQLSATLQEKELELAATRCGGPCVLFGGRSD
eukprot:COSAG01_NODE_3942_length_5509_cov_11.737893_3_plen_117_part_00